MCAELTLGLSCHRSVVLSRGKHVYLRCNCFRSSCPGVLENDAVVDAKPRIRRSDDPTVRRCPLGELIAWVESFELAAVLLLASSCYWRSGFIRTVLRFETSRTFRKSVYNF
ncbi:hypothetical protein BS17DRAFT_346218 [Gyrodon lividus]|nr:hypothetical protein BS17DRAFT_346218 [Gyrodon lividus]